MMFLDNGMVFRDWWQWWCCAWQSIWAPSLTMGWVLLVINFAMIVATLMAHHFLPRPTPKFDAKWLSVLKALGYTQFCGNGAEFYLLDGPVWSKASTFTSYHSGRQNVCGLNKQNCYSIEEMDGPRRLFRESAVRACEIQVSQQTLFISELAQVNSKSTWNTVMMPVQAADHAINV